MGKCAVCLCIMIGVIAIIIGLGAYHCSLLLFIYYTTTLLVKQKGKQQFQDTKSNTILDSREWRHHLKIFHQIDIRTGAQGKMLLVIKDTHSDYGAPIGDLYNELVPIIETGMKGKDDLEWITFYYDIPDEVLNKKRMRISYGLCTHTPEIQDLAFKLLVEAGKKGFKKRSLPKVEGFKTKFPFKYGISYAIAEYRVIDNLYMSAGKHANWTQKLKEIEFPEETIPFTEKSPVFHAKSIDYFLPLGDRFKEYLFNILAVPAYKQETVDLFKKLKTES